MGNPLKLIISFLILFTYATSAFSKDFSAIYQDAEIEKATVSAEVTNGIRTLYLTITNTTVGKLTILGVKGANHKDSKIIAKLGPEKYVALESLPILSEESLNMKNAGISIQLQGMKVPLKTGSIIELDLILLNGKMPFRAQVVENGERSSLLN